MLKSKLFLALLVFRLWNSLTIETFFQPDEHYQSIEPAHALVFGYGFVPWEYQTGIRGPAHQMIFAVPFLLLKLLGLDSPSSILLVPKIIGALQAAATDYFIAKFIRKQWPSTGRWGLILTVVSPWNYYVSPRTFSNSLETMLVAMALNYWPFDANRQLKTDDEFGRYVISLIKAFSFIGLGTLLRPTTILFWLVPALYQLRDHTYTFAFESLLAAAVIVMYNLIVDSFYYGKLTLAAYNFFSFNLRGKASFYGVNDWHYYLSQGLPMLLMTFVPIFIIGVLVSTRSIVGTPHRHQFLATIASTLVAYSLLAHKEARFVQPLQPILLGFAASGAARLHASSRVLARGVFLILLVLSIVLARAGTHTHQRGVMDLMTYIREHPTEFSVGRTLFLMPCHSTPWHAHHHAGPTVAHNLRFLTCEPPHTLTQPLAVNATYRDEADRFYDAAPYFGQPARLHTQLTPDDEGKERELDRLTWDVIIALDEWEKRPAFVATFEATLQAVLDGTPEGTRYTEYKRWFNSRFHDDPRRLGDVVLLKRQSAEEGPIVR
ncbi:glycosylphosphatidylinositol anchor biosynthesis [Savitreella phatthalungensis]